MSLSPGLSGVCLGILGVALCAAGCSVMTSQEPLFPVAPTPPVSGRAVITGVVTEADADGMRVVVRTTQAVQYTAFPLHEPPRFVVEIANAVLGAGVQAVSGTGGMVRRVEPLQGADDSVRVVIHLQQMVEPTVDVQDHQLRIALAETPARLPEVARQEPGARAPREEESLVALVRPALLPPGPEGTVVTGVVFEGRPGQSVVVIQTAGALPQVQVKQRSNPLRLVLEVQRARLQAQQETPGTVEDPNRVVAKLVAISPPDGGTSAVHIDVHLHAAAPFEIQQDDGTVRLTMTAPYVATAALAPSPLSSAPYRRVALPTSAAPQPILPHVAPVPAAPQLPLIAQTTVPRGRGAVPPAAAAPAARGGAVVAVPPAAPGASPGRLILPPTQAAPMYTGQRISLDFQEADINDILRLIAEVSGLNIIAGGDVQGKVTTRMVDVPWDQALDVILKTNGLAQEREGNIIRVAPLGRFNTEREERLKAQQTEVQAEPTVTRVVPINYATAAELKPNLEKLLSDRGTIFIDTRTNTLILTDKPRHLDDIQALIEKLDRATPQVMIEARIVESSRTFLRELGVQIGLAHSQSTDRAFPNTVDVRGGIVPPGRAAGSLDVPQAPANFLLDLPAAVQRGAGGAIGFSLASLGGSILDVQLSALESSGRGKIISSPKIATLDNTEAQIQSGVRIPFQTVSAEGTRTEFVDASISLKVTPHVTPNDFIGMKIVATKNEPDFGRTSAGGAPTITTREATTDMLVKDGDTVVIGGLYRRTIQSSRRAVPGLGDIPLLGWLFQSNQSRDDSDELLIFITPRIIRQSDEPPGRRKAALGY